MIGIMAIRFLSFCCRAVSSNLFYEYCSLFVNGFAYHETAACSLKRLLAAVFLRSFSKKKNEFIRPRL
jgi:hypothetical protein